MKKIIYLFAAGALLLAGCKAKVPVELNVMSFNIRYDEPRDSLNNWQYRKDIAAQTVMLYDADIVGTQEVLNNQLNDLTQRLPEYGAIGVGRADGKTGGEYSAILYKKSRLKEIESGTFWLSETPEVAGSKGWDGACERIATWAILQDVRTKQQIFAINTHLDHVGIVARQKGVALLLERTAQLSRDLPVIITGDFNATPESDVIQHVLNPANPLLLVHTKDVADEKSDTEWTFHGFGKVPLESRPFIDYIFVNPNFKVFKHRVIPEEVKGVFISDHSIVTAQIELP
ncbi:endonuclease [Candidatus Symbiothrix dinenymphae]|nr:endonuclease [Candidatus Symbiothrix dinenymphae]